MSLGWVSTLATERTSAEASSGRAGICTEGVGAAVAAGEWQGPAGPGPGRRLWQRREPEERGRGDLPHRIRQDRSGRPVSPTSPGRPRTHRGRAGAGDGPRARRVIAPRRVRPCHGWADPIWRTRRDARRSSPRRTCSPSGSHSRYAIPSAPWTELAAPSSCRSSRPPRGSVGPAARCPRCRRYRLGQRELSRVRSADSEGRRRSAS